MALPLALSECWWIRFRDVEPIRGALLKAHGPYFDKVVRDALENNKVHDRKPTGVTGLANALGRDPSSIHRALNGKTELTREDICAFASALGLKPGDLFLREEEKIARATSCLCNLHK